MNENTDDLQKTISFFLAFLDNNSHNIPVTQVPAVWKNDFPWNDLNTVNLG